MSELQSAVNPDCEAELGGTHAVASGSDRAHVLGQLNTTSRSVALLSRITAIIASGAVQHNSLARRFSGEIERDDPVLRRRSESVPDRSGLVRGAASATGGDVESVGEAAGGYELPTSAGS
jgi:hypothetical protein